MEGNEITECSYGVARLGVSWRQDSVDRFVKPGFGEQKIYTEGSYGAARLGDSWRQDCVSGIVYSNIYTSSYFIDCMYSTTVTRKSLT